MKLFISAVADPGFATGGGANLVRGRRLPMWLCFEKFVS